MQVKAIYKQGRVELLEPLLLKRDNVQVIVTVPADEVEDDNPYNLSPEVLERARQTRARFDAILHAPLPSDTEIPELNAKFEERLAAFQLRAAMRREQGRPV